jgi:hypothetical protein
MNAQLWATIKFLIMRINNFIFINGMIIHIGLNIDFVYE